MSAAEYVPMTDREEAEHFVFTQMASMPVTTGVGGWVVLTSIVEVWEESLVWDDDRERFDDCGDFVYQDGVAACARSEFDALELLREAVHGAGSGEVSWFAADDVPFVDDEGRRRMLLVSLNDIRSGGGVRPLTADYRAHASTLYRAGITDTRVWRETYEAGIPAEFALAALGGAA